VRPRGLRERIVDHLKIYKGGYPSPDPWLRRMGWSLLARLFGELFVYDLPWLGANRRVLDVGCGAGQSLRWAEANGWEAHGVEPSKVAVEAARASGLRRVRHGTLESVSYPGGYFDAITLCHVIEHMYSPRKALGECRRILKAGGILIVIAPNHASPLAQILGEWWPHWDIPRHLYHFTQAQLERMLAACGFIVEKSRLGSGLVSAYLHRTAFRRAASGFIRRNCGLRLPLALLSAFLFLFRILACRWSEFGDVCYILARKSPDT
jgi:SAM-dependent methyltransferase